MHKPLCLLAFSALALACAGVADLEPLGGTPVPGHDKTVVSERQGVRLTAQAADWPGAPIEREVTPLRILIENQSEVPIAVRYSAISLVDRGRNVSYAALPPLDIEGSIDVPITALDRRGINYAGFSVAPYYSPYYPGLSTWPHAFAYDDLYYDTYYGRWVQLQLPTPDMIANAMPEGVLEPGGQLGGWIYFEQVEDRGEPVVELRYEVSNAETGESMGTIMIPFAVD